MALLPLLPMAGAVLLIPLSLLFPGEVNGYGFSKFRNRKYQGRRVQGQEHLHQDNRPGPDYWSGWLGRGRRSDSLYRRDCRFLSGAADECLGEPDETPYRLGAAGAIAATFNAPIAGVMFAVEIVLLGNYELSSFSAIVISSGIATVVSRGFYGESPAFLVPQYDLETPLEIPFYIVFGVLVGVLAVFYIKVFHRIKDEFDVLRLHPQLKPVSRGIHCRSHRHISSSDHGQRV